MEHVLLTVAHGSAERTRLAELLCGAGIDLLVDVRRYPDSRTNPDVRREALDALMCSENVWWRCHRRLIAGVAVLGREVPVNHLMPNGRLSPHRPADGARRIPDGHLIWDGTLDGRPAASPPA